MKVELELPEIKGYRYTGKFRYPNKGDYCLNNGGMVVKACWDTCVQVPILEKVDQYITIDHDEAQRIIDEGNFPYYLDRTFNEEFKPTWVKKAFPRTQYFKKVED